MPVSGRYNNAVYSFNAGLKRNRLLQACAIAVFPVVFYLRLVLITEKRRERSCLIQQNFLDH